MNGNMIWLVVSLCALGGGPAAGQNWLPNITDELRDLSVLYMPEVNYSKPVINATYISKFDFDMRAMGHLYNSTHTIIDFIVNKQAYPEGMVIVSDGQIEFASPREEWRTLLAHYAGPIAVAVVVGLLVVIFPLTGLFWCCCQWCRVGKRRRPFDRKYDACLRGVLAIVFICLLTLFLFGVVCAFATDSQIESGTQATPDALHAGIQDTRTFLNATQAHARHLLVQNYKELEEQLNATLTNSGKAVLTKLNQFTRATSVQKLINMVSELESVPAQLKIVQRKTALLRNKADELNAGLRRVRSSLLRTLATCRERPCVQLQEKRQIGKLDTEIQYNKIPDVSDLLNNVSELLDGRMRTEVTAGLEVFAGIERTVDQHVPRVRDAISGTGARLAALADAVTARAANASAALAAAHAPAALQAALRRTAPWRRHATRAVAAAPLVVLALFVWGLLCGVCGKRADAYGASDCCNKGAGASCLLAGVGVGLAAGGVLALALLLYFGAGAAGARLVCDPLLEPRGNRVFEDVERFVRLERALYGRETATAGEVVEAVEGEEEVTLTSALVQCHANRTVYAALGLRRALDVGAEGAAVARRVAAVAAALHTEYPPRGRPLQVLSPAARDRLKRLADSELSDFNFDKILYALETNMTSFSLEELSAQLEAAAQALAPRGGYAEVSRELREAAQALARLHQEVVLPMLRATADINATASSLRDALRFNQSSLQVAIYARLLETREVEKFLNEEGPDLVQNLTREFAAHMGRRLQQYVSMVEAAARRSVGRCGPLSSAFNATRDALCTAVLLPTNGFWMSVAWCLVLFPALAAVAQRLARLYAHPDPYPGPLVEAEYLYDAYADRDNVPLANAYSAEKRGARRREAEGAGASHVAPPVDAHHARRYNDMAPKHWEEGPPRYHGPTEYERPPPYYYPGPTDRQ